MSGQIVAVYVIIFAEPLEHSQLRVSYSPEVLSPPLTSVNASYSFLLKVWDNSLMSLQEEVYILYLNSMSEVINWRRLNTGNSDETLFNIKLALACGLACMASKIIIAHNHPSGMVKPSISDIKMTKRLSQATELVDIKLIDHIIIAPGRYYSFRDHDLI